MDYAIDSPQSTFGFVEYNRICLDMCVHGTRDTGFMPSIRYEEEFRILEETCACCVSST